MGTPTRVCVYPKDVQRVLGKTYTQARLYLRRLKKDLGKQDSQLVSVREFCEYSGLPYEDVVRCIGD